MRKYLIQGAIGLVVFVGIYFLTTWVDGKHQEQIVQKYNLSEAGRSFAISCKSTVDDNNLEFERIADTLDGCGCMATHIEKNAPDYIATAEFVAKDVLTVRGTPEDSYWDQKATALGMERVLYDEIAYAISDSLVACDGE